MPTRTTDELRIHVPDSLRDRPIDPTRARPRTGGALAAAGFRTLGDLDGVSLADLRRRVGASIASDMIQVVRRAGGGTHHTAPSPDAAGANPEATPTPISEAALGLPLDALPLSTRLERLLRELGATHAAHLARIPPAVLSQRRGAGANSLAEYQRVRRVLREGLYEERVARFDAAAAAEFGRRLLVGLHQLAEGDRIILLRRFDTANGKPAPLAYAGEHLGITKERVRQKSALAFGHSPIRSFSTPRNVITLRGPRATLIPTVGIELIRTVPFKLVDLNPA